MESNQIDTLIEQANIAFQRQDWQSALDYLNQAAEIDASHTEVLNAMGQCFINLGQAQKAIPIYERIVNQKPDVPEVHNNLGVVYMISNNLIKAEMSFKEAIYLDDSNTQAWKNLAQLYLQQGDKLTDGVQILSALIQSDPYDTESLFQLALCYEIGDDIESAIFLLERILEIKPDHTDARKVLDDIESKVTPSADIGRIARPEHASKLSGLKSLLDDSNSSVQVVRPQTQRQRLTQKAAFFAPDEFSGHERLPSISAYYANQGYEVIHEPVFDQRHLNEYDSLIFYSPNLSGQLVNAVNLCIQNKKKYFIDMDIDFHSLPADHPAYTQFGSGNPNAIKVINIILDEAETVTTASQVLAERIEPLAKHVDIALPSWNPADVWWSRPNPSRNTVNVGWMGSKPDLPNLLSIKQPLQKFFQENPTTVWFSVGSEEAYDLFSDLPDERRRFLPPPTGESIAYMLTNFDILIVPLLLNKFNQAKSDLSLLYASVRGIPWVASPIPSFLEWQAGGMIAERLDDWTKILNKLANDPSLRNELGGAGKTKAQTRKLMI